MGDQLTAFTSTCRARSTTKTHQLLRKIDRAGDRLVQADIDLVLAGTAAVFGNDRVREPVVTVAISRTVSDRRATWSTTGRLAAGGAAYFIA